MKLLDKNRPDRTYPVRAATQQKLQTALNIEQANRQKASGKKTSLMAIVSDWLEEKADVVIRVG